KGPSRFVLGRAGWIDRAWEYSRCPTEGLCTQNATHSIGIGGGANEASAKLESRGPVSDLAGTWNCIRCGAHATNGTDRARVGIDDAKLRAHCGHSRQCDTRRER